LLTGATGLLGAYLLDRLLDTPHELHLLVRPTPAGTPGERLGRLAQYFHRPDLPGRVRLHCGDVLRPGVDLGPASREYLRDTITDVIHAAACVAFEGPLQRIRETNLGGTRRLLEVVPAAARFFHVSTAYVAGRHGGLFREADLGVGQSFRNSYERSKFDTEVMIREAFAERPGLLTVLRPGIVVGESGNGRTFQFHGLYRVLRLLEAFARRFPGEDFCLTYDPEGTQNYVAVDQVAEMMAEIVASPELWGSTYHLTSEPALLNERLRGMIESRIPVRIRNRAPDAACRPLNAAGVRRAAPYLDYLHGEARFACENRNRLRAAARCAPLDEDLFDRLLEYCRRTRWGYAREFRR
ncbi:MAG: SDR family oxidoreductase, partial [Lentisphaeria bacterium]|nr:SDR family oxidoreductase [Lentisphaeria bacterium]